MIKQNQTIRRLLPKNCLSVSDHFVGLALKVLKDIQQNYKLNGVTQNKTTVNSETLYTNEAHVHY